MSTEGAESGGSRKHEHAAPPAGHETHSCQSEHKRLQNKVCWLQLVVKTSPTGVVSPTGNILLNIIVQASIPCTRVGKNNVMLMCVPNPPVDEKNPNTPIPLLVRVKTTEDADELHKILEEKKS